MCFFSHYTTHMDITVCFPTYKIDLVGGKTNNSAHMCSTMAPSGNICLAVEEHVN